MGTCESKRQDKTETYKFSFSMPIRSFEERYQPTNEFYYRSKHVNSFKGLEKSSNKPVLVKQISTLVPPQRVLYEIAVLMKLDHPLVIKLINYFEGDSHYFLIFQFVDGTRILGYFESMQTRLSLEETRLLFKQAIHALHFIHGKKVFHRKLDFNSLFYGPSGVTICAFDDAINFESVGDKGPFTTAEVSNLNKAFQAPEVISGEYGFKSDIWALGVIFYALLIGDMPFKGKSNAELESSIRSKPVDRLLLLQRGATELLVDLIEKMLEKTPENRLSAEALLKHSFIHATQHSNGNTAIINTFQEIKDFARKSRISQHFLLHVSDFLILPTNRAMLFEEFCKFDSNNDGRIDLKEFVGAIRKTGLLFQEQQAKDVFGMIDHNKNGSIEFREFLTVFVKIRREDFMTKLKAIFKEMDLNGDQLVSLDELKEVLGEQPDVAEIIEDFVKTSGKDKQLTFDEFKNFFLEFLDSDV